MFGRYVASAKRLFPENPLHLKTVIEDSLLASEHRRAVIQALPAFRGLLNFLSHRVRLIPEPALSAKNQTVVLLPQPIFSPNFFFSFSSVREGKVWYSVRTFSRYDWKVQDLFVL